MKSEVLRCVKLIVYLARGKKGKKRLLIINPLLNTVEAPTGHLNRVIDLAHGDQKRTNGRCKKDGAGKLTRHDA